MNNNKTTPNRLIETEAKGMVSRGEECGGTGRKGEGEYSQQYCDKFAQ